MRDTRKYLESNENKYTTYQNLRHAEKAVLTGKFIVVNVCIKKKQNPKTIT